MRLLLPLLLSGCLSAAAAPSELPGYDGLFQGDPELSAEQIALKSDKELRLLRNEVFAQYGRAFTSEDLKAHFGAQPWYTADPDYDEGRLTARDKTNVALMQSMEGDRRAEQRKVGEYYGPGFRLLLTGEKDCEMVTGDDLYDWESEPCHWQSRGQWVVTYTEGSWERPQGLVYAWRLNDSDRSVTKRVKVGQPRG